MASIGKPEKFISRLNQEEIKKIFPDDYYQKYANHLRILEFEKKMIADSGKKSDIVKFIKRKAQQHSQVQKKRNKINKYDDIQDALAKNKEQLQRMYKYVKNIDNKLKYGQLKQQNMIRNPLQGYAPINEEVFDKMRQIDDREYTTFHNKQQLKKKAQEKYVKFTKRDRAKSMQTSSLASLRENTVKNSEDNQISITNSPKNQKGFRQSLGAPPKIPFQEAAFMTPRQHPHQSFKQIMDSTTLINSKINPQNPHSSVQYIVNINSALKKISKINRQRQHQKIMINSNFSMLSRQMSTKVMRVNKFMQNQKERRDLISQTKKIKQTGQQIQILSRYDNLMKARSLQKLIAMKI